MAAIDLGNLLPGELEKLAAASTELGCFRLINHGMPVSLLASMKETVRSLFEIPTEAKHRNVTHSLADGGYVSPGPDMSLYESFGIHDAGSPTDVHSFCSLLETSPQQRFSALLCSALLCFLFQEFFEKLHGVIIRVASKVAESLGLLGCSFEEWICHARLNSYEFKFEEDIGCVGVPIHTDSGFLTLLQEDECVGGLEIMDANGDFISIDPVPGTLLAFIGDVGKAWSNGRLKNVKHRVICKKAIPRISIALFLLAPKDDKIEPVAAFIDTDHPKLYQTFMYNEYRRQRNISSRRAGEILPACMSLKQEI